MSVVSLADQKQVLRILSNLTVLLSQGLYPGHASAGIAEAQDWIDHFTAELQKKVNADEQPASEETPVGVFSETGSGRMGADGVPNP